MSTITLDINACFYTWYVTASYVNGCGNEVGSTPYYTSESNYNLITKFYNDTSLLSVYKPGAGTIGFNIISGPITLAAYSGNIDINGNISSITSCP